MHPKIWGRYFWAVLFLRAMVHPVEANDKDVQALRNFFICVVDNLPCPACRTHGRVYLEQHPPNCNTKAEAIEYLRIFKNVVNKRVGTPTLSKDEVNKELVKTFFNPQNGTVHVHSKWKTAFFTVLGIALCVTTLLSVLLLSRRRKR